MFLAAIAICYTTCSLLGTVINSMSYMNVKLIVKCQLSIGLELRVYYVPNHRLRLLSSINYFAINCCLSKVTKL